MIILAAIVIFVWLAIYSSFYLGKGYGQKMAELESAHEAFHNGVRWGRRGLFCELQKTRHIHKGVGELWLVGQHLDKIERIEYADKYK